MKRAVGIIIENDQEEILLLKRSEKEDDEQGKWENCGGNCEINESFEDCAFRESREELGVQISNLELLYIDKPNENVEVHIFKAKINEEPKMQDEMVAEFRWVKKENLKNMDLTSYCYSDFRRLGWM